jgi:hypothetical protein
VAVVAIVVAAAWGLAAWRQPQRPGAPTDLPAGVAPIPNNAMISASGMPFFATPARLGE